MANVIVSAERLAPVGGANSKGHKAGVILPATKAAQNDTLTITEAVEIIHADLVIVASGVAEPVTISGNVITLTSATTGSVRGIVYYI